MSGAATHRAGVPPEGYLDASAGEPLHPAAREALLLAAEQGWADPSAVTPPARRARILLDGALDSLGAVLGIARSRIVPTAGDPLTAAVDQLLSSARERFSHPVLIVSAVEREPVLGKVRELEESGIESHTIDVDEFGRLRMDRLREVLDEVGPRAVLSLQAANGEVGTLQPIDEVAHLATSVGAALHVDYHSAIGRVPLVDATYISAAANTWGGPRGVGVIISADRASTSTLREKSDAISLPLLIAAAAALEARIAEGPSEDARLRELIAGARQAIAEIPDAEVIGDPARRLPHVLTASFLYVDGQVLMDALARHGLYVGSGSACIASRVEPSHVLTAMGRLSHGNIRLALPHGTRASDMERLLALLPGTVQAIRHEYGMVE